MGRVGSGIRVLECMRYARLLLVYFKDVGTEGQRGQEICPSFYDQKVAGPGLKSRSPASIVRALSQPHTKWGDRSTLIPKLLMLTLQRRFDKSQL